MMAICILLFLVSLEGELVESEENVLLNHILSISDRYAMLIICK